MNILVLGVGNPILTDDAVGFRVAHLLKKARPELTVIETAEAGEIGRGDKMRVGAVEQ